MIKNFRNIVNKSTLDRKKLCIPPLPLNIEEVDKLCKILEANDYKNKSDKFFLLDQFKNRIIPGVDETSYLKANFLNKICNNKIQCDIIDKQHAIYILGTMQGGYNVDILVGLLENEELAEYSYKQLKNTILIFDHYNVVEQYYKKGNPWAKQLLESWANAEWFTNKPKIQDKIPLTIFKVNGETNTDDLSPAQDAWSRPDIPLHARAMLKCPRENIIPNIDYEVGPLNQIELLKQKKIDIAYVGDIVGTGSSRKSATNSILWHFGKKIMYVPNKKTGGYCFGGKIAPIFLSTMEDSGAFPIEMDVSKLEYGQNIDLYPYEGIVTEYNTNKVITDWKMHSETLLDSVRAGGRIQLMIGKALTQKAMSSLDLNSSSIYIKKNINVGKECSLPEVLPESYSESLLTKRIQLRIIKSLNEKIVSSLELNSPGVFIERNINVGTSNKYTLAQKIVGKACNLPGVLPGTYCEPLVTSVGSQDTTGPMTRDELKDLACLGFSADLVMQSFCHTSAYPKPIDVITHNTLPDFIKNRGGISLKPGDGIIHSWLNRMLLPDTVGTGGDSHTRFPIGISFPAGSGLVAFSAATGMMPLDMPESVLVKFSGNMQPGITLRDIVHSIPYYARKQGLLTLDKKDKKNIFNGNILEIQGLPDLTCEQAFELSDASAERSSAGCTIQLNKEPIIEYLTSNISLLHWMIKEGYGDKDTIMRRIEKMEKWLDEPVLLEPDEGAFYKETIHINLNDIKEPILCAPNDPDHAVLLSEVENTDIQEVFIGSCMTNIGHFRAAGELLKYHEKPLNTTLWIAPPTKMDEKVLKEEGYYNIFKKHNLNIEMPGCSLCMGNQARVEDNSTVLSTSTRNFPNRLGKGANVFLASAELSAISAIEGKIPDYNTYMNYMNRIQKNHDTIFNYMNFDKMKDYIK